MKKSRVEQAVTTKGHNLTSMIAVPIVMLYSEDGWTSSFLKKETPFSGLVRNVTMLQDNALHRLNFKEDSVVQKIAHPEKASIMKCGTK